MNNSGIKMALIAASLFGVYCLGEKIGERKEKSESKNLLDIYKKKNESLNREVIILLEQNSKLKRFYNVVEYVKMEEA